MKKPSELLNQIVFSAMVTSNHYDDNCIKRSDFNLLEQDRRLADQSSLFDLGKLCAYEDVLETLWNNRKNS